MTCEGSKRKAKWLTKCELRHGICSVCGRMFRCDKDGKVNDHEV